MKNAPLLVVGILVVACLMLWKWPATHDKSGIEGEAPLEHSPPVEQPISIEEELRKPTEGSIGRADVQGVSPGWSEFIEHDHSHKALEAALERKDNVQESHVRPGQYVDDPGKQVLEDGVLTIYHPDGVTVSEVGPFEDGKREGYWESFSEDGGLEMVGIYVRGVAEGNWKAWHDNGSLRSSGNVVNGELHGYVQFWKDNGEDDVELTGTYVAGVLAQ